MPKKKTEKLAVEIDGKKETLLVERKGTGVRVYRETKEGNENVALFFGGYKSVTRGLCHRGLCDLETAQMAVAPLYPADELPGTVREACCGEDSKKAKAEKAKAEKAKAEKAEAKAS